MSAILIIKRVQQLNNTLLGCSIMVHLMSILRCRFTPHADLNLDCAAVFCPPLPLTCSAFFFKNCPDIVGVLELKEETIESLLAAACLLQLSQVIQVCCNFLMKQLHPSNCLGIRSFADAQGCVDLLNVAHNYTMVGTLKEPGPVYADGWMELFIF